MADPIESIPKLRSGEFDMALSHDATFETVDLPPSAFEGGDGADARGGIEVIRLFDDPMYVAMPIAHPLAGSGVLDLANFADEPWMLATTQSCPDSRRFLRACHAAGFEPRIAFQSDDYPAMLGFVAAGVGVALVPDMVTRGIRDDVAIRPLDPAPPPRPILVALPAGYRSPAAAAMLTVLREVSDTWIAGRPVLAAT